MNNIDLVYPCHLKDKDTINICIKYAKKNIINLNNIYIISKTKISDNAIWIPETNFPFSFNDICDIIGNHWKTGWYYQQLLKLSIFKCNIKFTDNILICDADTIFIKPVHFINNNNQLLFNISTSDGSKFYDEFLTKLLPNFKKILEPKFSGISHHMIMNKYISENLINNVEKTHNIVFWKAILNIINQKYNCDTIFEGNTTIENGTGRFSEYETYLNYCLKYFPEKIKIRPLNSIFAYKGFLNIKNTEFTQGHLSRTSKGLIKIVPEHIEKSRVFDTFEECIDFHISECIKQNFDSVTFQNHTRDGFDNHKKKTTDKR